LDRGYALFPNSRLCKEGFVKVKVIEIERPWSVQVGAEIERALREWLDDNPNASIEHVAQTPISPPGKYGETERLLVTIFYRD
jgi:hypothetical protein